MPEILIPLSPDALAVPAAPASALVPANAAAPQACGAATGAVGFAALLAGRIGEPAVTAPEQGLAILASARAGSGLPDATYAPRPEARGPFAAATPPLAATISAPEDDSLAVMLGGGLRTPGSPLPSAESTAAPNARPALKQCGAKPSAASPPTDVPAAAAVQLILVAVPAPAQPRADGASPGTPPDPVDATAIRSPGKVGTHPIAAMTGASRKEDSFIADPEATIALPKTMPASVPDPTALAAPGTTDGTNRAIGTESPTASVPQPPVMHTMDAATGARTAPTVHMDLPGHVGAAGWREDFATGVNMLVTHKISSAELRVQPAELGPVQVSIRIEGGEASIACAAHHPDTRHAMESALPRLREMLEANGISVGNASVDTGSPGRDPGGAPASSLARNPLPPGLAQEIVPDIAAQAHARSEKLVDIFA